MKVMQAALGSVVVAIAGLTSLLVSEKANEEYEFAGVSRRHRQLAR